MTRSAIIGQTAQPVQFANLLLKAGHEVVAACSPDDDLKNWAHANHVAHQSDLKAFGECCEVARIEYLFSIVNYRMLPKPLLSLPSKLAINYHDGPLPKYAGLYSTTWAILNEEKFHGITWHVMEELADVGDILKQVMFPIDGKETAASLNMKCYLAAARSFRELLTELAAGTYTRIPQNLSGRTYFGARAPLPEVAPSWSKEHLDAYRRAVDFGASVNPFIGRIPREIVALSGQRQNAADMSE